MIGPLVQPNEPEISFWGRLLCQISFELLEDQPVIKSAASAAFPMTRMQGSPPAEHPDGEAALAANVIMGLIFKHLERNLAVLEWVAKNLNDSESLD